MKEVDYIVVGLGIAGISICEQLEAQGKRFVVFNSGSGATVKSGGILNPTVLKRFTAAWNATEFFEYAIPFYNKLSEKLKEEIFTPTPVLRIFKSVEEQNNWTVASDKKELGAFLSAELIKNSNPSVLAPFGFGRVNGTGRIHAAQLLASYKKYLDSSGSFSSEEFDYNLLQEREGGIQYKDISATKIIFSEGATAVNNPYFPKNALIGNKGEYVIIKAPELNTNDFLKGSMFVIPLGNDEYKVGATYAREDYSSMPTEDAKKQILSKMESFINCKYEVVDQVTGVRPTTKDRKPLLGSLSSVPDKVFFNGLGTRGFLMAPLLSEMLYKYLENKLPLPKELDINRMC